MKHLKKILFALICSLLLLVVIFVKVDFDLVMQSLKKLRISFWAMGLGVLCLALFLQSARWHLVLVTQGIRIHFFSACKATFYGHFFNTILMGPATGDIFKSNLFAQKHNLPFLQILSCSWLDRMIAGIGSILFGITVIIFTLFNGKTLDIEQKLPATSKAISVCILVTGLIFILWKTKALNRIPLLARLKQNFLEVFHKLLHAKGKVAIGVILGFCVQILLSSVMAWSVAAVCTTETEWIKLFWVFPVISMLSCLPISFGGLGVRDGASILLLGAYGIQAQDAIAASCICLCTYLLLAVFGGLMAITETGRR